MAVEIEHKYLVIDDSYKNLAFQKLEITQGYLNRCPQRIVRVRTVNDKGYITIKGKTIKDSRPEFEYEIPFNDALEILKLAEPGIVVKTRYLIRFDGLVWEVDEFHDRLNGVVVAEVELPYSDHTYAKPDFIGADITGDPRYFNSVLSN